MSGTPHHGSKPQCNSFVCSDRPLRLDQKQKPSIFLHHVSQIASTLIQWPCRYPRSALNLRSHLSKQCTSCLHSDHGSPKMPSQLLLPPKMHNLFPLCSLNHANMSPYTVVRSLSQCTSPLLLPLKMRNLSGALPLSRLSPLSYISSASGCDLLTPNPGRQGFSCSASF